MNRVFPSTFVRRPGDFVLGDRLLSLGVSRSPKCRPPGSRLGHRHDKATPRFPLAEHFFSSGRTPNAPVATSTPFGKGGNQNAASGKSSNHPHSHGEGWIAVGIVFHHRRPVLHGEFGGAGHQLFRHLGIRFQRHGDPRLHPDMGNTRHLGKTRHRPRHKRDLQKILSPRKRPARVGQGAGPFPCRKAERPCFCPSPRAWSPLIAIGRIRSQAPERNWRLELRLTRAMKGWFRMGVPYRPQAADRPQTPSIILSLHACWSYLSLTVLFPPAFLNASPPQTSHSPDTPCSDPH
jgi:hypothetical protein